MTATTLLALVFLVLLGFEWRYQRRKFRLGAALLALIVLVFAQPNYTRAARRAVVIPPAQRVTQNSHGTPVSEYVSGVRTMKQAVVDDSDMGANARLLGVAVLMWLACSPAFRSARRSPLRSGDQLPRESGS